MRFGQFWPFQVSSTPGLSDFPFFQTLRAGSPAISDSQRESASRRSPILPGVSPPFRLQDPGQQHLKFRCFHTTTARFAAVLCRGAQCAPGILSILAGRPMAAPTKGCKFPTNTLFSCDFKCCCPAPGPGPPFFWFYAIMVAGSPATTNSRRESVRGRSPIFSDFQPRFGSRTRPAFLPVLHHNGGRESGNREQP